MRFCLESLAGQDRAAGRGGREKSGDACRGSPRSVVFTMLSNDEAVEQAVFGANGILASPERPIHVSMSTISLALAERLTAAHGSLGLGPGLRAPRRRQIRQAFHCRRSAASALSVCAPLFDAIGQRTFTVGDEPRSANVIKLCGNYMIMAAIESLGEAMTLAAKNGVERRTCSTY